MKKILYGRLAFPSLYQPRKSDLGEDKYEATILIKPDAPCVADYVKECLAIATEAFGAETARAVLQKHPVFRKGDDRANPPEGYAGMLYLTLRSKMMPDFYGPDRRKLTVDEAKQLFYAGCYVNIVASPWKYEAKSKDGKSVINRGISHDFLAVQFAGHGDAFSGRPTVSASDLPDMSVQGADAFAGGDDNIDDLL